MERRDGEHGNSCSLDVPETLVNADDSVTQEIDFEEEGGAQKTVGLLNKNGGNIAELDRINRQLAEEYKYVEGLRRNLKLAEQALKKQVQNQQTVIKSTTSQKSAQNFLFKSADMRSEAPSVGFTSEPGLISTRN